MAQMLGGYTEAFADEVKRATHRLFGLPDKPNEYEALKDVSLDEFNGLTPRQAYIWMSEDVMKPKFGKGVFGEKLAERIRWYWKESSNRVIWITDSGFREEAEVIADKFGRHNCFILRLRGAGCSFVGDSRTYWDSTGMEIPEAKFLNNFAVPSETGVNAWLAARNELCDAVRKVVNI